MNILTTAKYAIGVTAAVALFAGCSGGSPSAPGTTGMTPSTGHGARALPPMLLRRMTNALGLAPVIRATHQKSWMSPEAKKDRPLLYTSNQEENNVIVYAFKGKNGKVIGTLTDDMAAPYGDCSDTKGNVYIVNDEDDSPVVVFAHGASTPTTTLSNDYGEGIGCAYDPTTGNLAVSNFAGSDSGYGDVVIYANASGSGTVYSVADTYLWGPAYDNNGNLFVEGENIDTGAKPLLEMPKGSTTFTTISLPFTIDFPASAYWDGQYVGVGDQEYEGNFTTGIYRVTISGSTATLVSQTDYEDNCYETYNDVVQGVIYQRKFVGGNLFCSDAGDYRIDYWNYANGGDPLRYINGAESENTSFGQAVSP